MHTVRILRSPLKPPVLKSQLLLLLLLLLLGIIRAPALEADMSKKIDQEHQSMLARLATTVRADSPSARHGGSGSTPAKSAFEGAGHTGSKRPTSAVSRFRQKLQSFRAGSSRAAGGEHDVSAAKAAKKMRKLAKQMAKGKPAVKIRKSRLPFVIALVALVCAGAAFSVYRSIHLPKVHVSHVAKTWLDNTSGVAHPKVHRAVHTVHAVHKAQHPRHLAHHSKHHKKASHKLAHHKKHHRHLAHKKHTKHRSQLAKVKHKKHHIQTASYQRAE